MVNSQKSQCDICGLTSRLHFVVFYHLLMLKNNVYIICILLYLYQKMFKNLHIFWLSDKVLFTSIYLTDIEFVAPYQHVHAAIVGSIPTWRNELFSYRCSGNETNSGVEFRLSTRNVSLIRQRVRDLNFLSFKSH